MEIWVSENTPFVVLSFGDNMRIVPPSPKRSSNYDIFAYTVTDCKHMVAFDNDIYDVEIRFESKINFILIFDFLKLVVCKMNTDQVILPLEDLLLESNSVHLLGSLMVNGIKCDIYENTQIIFDKLFRIINTDEDLVLQSITTETDEEQKRLDRENERKRREEDEKFHNDTCHTLLENATNLDSPELIDHLDLRNNHRRELQNPKPLNIRTTTTTSQIRIPPHMTVMYNGITLVWLPSSPIINITETVVVKLEENFKN